MNGDDLTRNLNDDPEDKTTQPTITAVFRLLQEVKNGQTALSSRLDAFESSVNSRFEALEARVREVQDGQTSLNSRIEALESSVNSRFEALEARVREVQDGQTSLNSRFDAFESSVNSRFEALEARLDRDFASVDARFAEMSDEMKDGLLRLSDKLCDSIDRQRMHADADIENITRRLRKLESKAS